MLKKKKEKKRKPHSRLASVSSELNTLIHHNIVLFSEGYRMSQEMSSGGQTLAYSVQNQVLLFLMP